MRPGGACTACPGFSLSLRKPRRNDGRRDRVQEPQPPQRAHRRKQSTAPGTIPPETPINAPQSRPGRGCYPSILPAAKTPHSGAQSRPQRASRRGYRNAGEGKPTAATAPAQHPGRKSGRFSAIFRVIFCHFSRLCPALPVSFIVGKSESRKSGVDSRKSLGGGSRSGSDSRTVGQSLCSSSSPSESRLVWSAAMYLCRISSAE